MDNDLVSRNGMTPATIQATEQEARAVQEIQASLIIAKRFPRDEEAARANILTACKRLDLAERAIYDYPRGGTSVTGPSIRLAEEIARHWGNLDYGLREIDRRPGISVMEAYCWDMQSNVRARRQFEVPHIRYRKESKGGSVSLDDPRDVYEMTANQGARRLRACILEVVPGHVAGEAVEACRQTMSGGAEGVPIQGRAVRMVEAFKEYGVTQPMVELFLGHKLSALSEPELVRLRGIFNSMRDGYSTREQWFDTAAAGTADQAEALKERLAKTKSDPEPRPKPPAEEPKKRGRSPKKKEGIKEPTLYESLLEELQACSTRAGLVALYNREVFMERGKKMTQEEQNALALKYGDMLDAFDRAKRQPKAGDQGKLVD